MNHLYLSTIYENDSKTRFELSEIAKPPEFTTEEPYAKA